MLAGVAAMALSAQPVITQKRWGAWLFKAIKLPRAKRRPELARIKVEAWQKGADGRFALVRSVQFTQKDSEHSDTPGSWDFDFEAYSIAAGRVWFTSAPWPGGGSNVDITLFTWKLDQPSVIGLGDLFGTEWELKPSVSGRYLLLLLLTHPSGRAWSLIDMDTKRVAKLRDLIRLDEDGGMDFGGNGHETRYRWTPGDKLEFQQAQDDSENSTFKTLRTLDPAAMKTGWALPLHEPSDRWEE